MNFGFKLQSSGRSESFETHLTERKKTPLKDVYTTCKACDDTLG